MTNHLLTTAEAASHLGVSPSRVRHLILDGRLPATKHGRDLFICEADLALPRVAERKPGRPPRLKPLRQV